MKMNDEMDNQVYKPNLKYKPFLLRAYMVLAFSTY